MIGEYLLEDLAKIPAECEYASEFRYRNPIIEEGTVVVAVSQSGETADTLAALSEAKERGALALGVINAVGSSIPRSTDAGVYLRAGPEIGVASTKAFTAQVAVLTMIALFMLLNARDYPGQRLQDAWELVLGSQMHDILPGTSVPLAYDLSWNDEVIAANQFAAVLADSASTIISAMDTTAQGTPIVVYNPLSWERRDIVEAEVLFESDVPKAVVVLDADGQLVPAQILWADDHGVARIAFAATVPSIGFATFDVRLSQNEFPGRPSELSITPDGRRLENSNYIVKLNAQGDVESIFDKQSDTEVLSAPARIGLHYENPSQWPAWNMFLQGLILGPPSGREAEHASDGLDAYPKHLGCQNE